MKGFVALLSLACGVACGGKASQSRSGVEGSAGSGNPAPAQACLPLPSTVSGEQAQAVLLARLGVELTADAVDPNEADALVRGQQLVDAVEAGLEDVALPIPARELMRSFVGGLAAESLPLPADLPEGVVSAMEQELDAFANHWMLGERGSIAALLTSSQVRYNGALAEHYGYERPVSGMWTELEAPVGTRAGLMTLGPFLARVPSPPARGMHLAESLGCVTIPPPPQLESIWSESQQEPVKVVVARAYSDDQVSCWACHRYYMGFAIALDRYDELGRYRQSLNDAPIDTSYTIAPPYFSPPDAGGDSGDRDVPFATPTELGQILSESLGVRACLVKRMSAELGVDLSESELSCVVGALSGKDASMRRALALLSPAMATP